jgi:hypothetical protein
VIAVILPTIAFIAYYNWRLTGDPLLTPHQLYTNTYLTSPIFFGAIKNPCCTTTISRSNITLESLRPATITPHGRISGGSRKGK